MSDDANHYRGDADRNDSADPTLATNSDEPVSDDQPSHNAGPTTQAPLAVANGGTAEADG